MIGNIIKCAVEQLKGWPEQKIERSKPAAALHWGPFKLEAAIGQRQNAFCFGAMNVLFAELEKAQFVDLLSRGSQRD